MDNIREDIELIVNQDSCYPKDKRKTPEKRRQELIKWYEKYHDLNLFYNIYGMDREESEPIDNWLDRGVFRKQRHDVNAKWYPLESKFPYDYTLLMRDKFAFEMFMRTVHRGKGYVDTVALLIGRKEYLLNENGLIRVSSKELCEELDGQRLVIKETFGESGDNVRIITIRNYFVEENGKQYDAEKFFSEISNEKKTWLFQKYIKQHEILNKINETSVNTLRVITFNTGETIELGRTILRYGRKGSIVDNADKGGLITGINADGTLHHDYFNFSSYKRFDESPFYGVKLPFFEEAIQLVKDVHATVPGLFTIGWDVAFGVEGPIIIEGNDGWDPYTAQAPMGNAMRKMWESLLRRRQDYYGCND